MKNKINLVYGTNWLGIKVRGYGDYGSCDGYGVPVGLEVVNGRLRVVIWPDINEQKPIIIDLEKARETSRKKT